MRNIFLTIAAIALLLANPLSAQQIGPNPSSQSINGLISAGPSITITGSGTTASPYAISGKPSQLPFASGRFYGLPLGASLTTVLTQAGILYAYPFYIPKATTITSMNLSVTTGITGGAAHIGIYADTGNALPGALVAGSDAGALSATANAVVSNTGLSIALQPGNYWAASIYTATAVYPTVAGIQASYNGDIANTMGYASASDALAGSAQAVTGLYSSGQTYGTLPSTFPAITDYIHNAVTPALAIGF